MTMSRPSGTCGALASSAFFGSSPSAYGFVESTHSIDSISAGSPSTRTWKFSGFRFGSGFPLKSTARRSTITRWTVICSWTLMSCANADAQRARASANCCIPTAHCEGPRLIRQPPSRQPRNSPLQITPNTNNIRRPRRRIHQSFNGAEMKIARLIALVVLAASASFAADASRFDTYFKDKTMRVDYFHTGGPKGEVLALHRVVPDGPRAGSRSRLVVDI